MTTSTGSTGHTPADHWSAVAAAWDRGAEYVDEHSTASTDALFEAVAIGPGDRVLELAAGPGALGRRLAALAGPTGRVVLSDVARGMVEVAARRNATIENIETAVLDASDIDLGDGSFDVVLCRMGLMFAPEPALAFAEIRRVLAPGGRFAALTWAALEHNPWMTCVGMAGMMHGVVAGPPPFAPGGIFSLGDPAALEGLADDAGFVDVTTAAIPTMFHAASIDAHIAQVSSLAGPLAEAFANATPEQRDAVRRTAAELAAEHIHEDGVSLPGRAVLVAGRSPVEGLAEQ
jgi:SAM-dependent methyltransferase